MTLQQILDSHRQRIEDAFNRNYDKIAVLPISENDDPTHRSIAFWKEYDALIDALCVADHYADEVREHIPTVLRGLRIVEYRHQDGVPSSVPVDRRSPGSDLTVYES